MSDAGECRRRLVEILRAAYHGELAAGLAYRGHARSVRDPEERRAIELIEAEEAHHRRAIGAILSDLGERPGSLRDFRAGCVGRTLGALCHLAGWFVPMYGAGRLESGNVREYEAAARHARGAGLEHLVEPLLGMAEVEWEHERYFRAKVRSHRASRWLRPWPEPPPKATIRASFSASASVLSPAAERALAATPE
jgi:rubrerythrin